MNDCWCHVGWHTFWFHVQLSRSCADLWSSSSWTEIPSIKMNHMNLQLIYWEVGASKLAAAHQIPAGHSCSSFGLEVVCCRADDCRTTPWRFQRLAADQMDRMKKKEKKKMHWVNLPIGCSIWLIVIQSMGKKILLPLFFQGQLHRLVVCDVLDDWPLGPWNRKENMTWLETETVILHHLLNHSDDFRMRTSHWDTKPSSQEAYITDVVGGVTNVLRSTGNQICCLDFSSQL